MIASSDTESAKRRIAGLDWWHTIEVVPEVGVRAKHKLGIRGRPAAVRARPLTL